MYSLLWNNTTSVKWALQQQQHSWAMLQYQCQFCCSCAGTTQQHKILVAVVLLLRTPWSVVQEVCSATMYPWSMHMLIFFNQQLEDIVYTNSWAVFSSMVCGVRWIKPTLVILQAATLETGILPHNWWLTLCFPTQLLIILPTSHWNVLTKLD